MADQSPTLPSLLGMDLDQLKQALSAAGQPSFRAAQVYDWLYRQAASGFEAMSNLPASLRSWLAEQYRLGREAPVKCDASSDGTKKYLFGAAAGRFVEAAWIPEEDRGTLCLSTQVGCKMGCVFCATGKQGFQAQLSAGAILNQYLSLPEREQVTNIVYMGMGEPFDNPAAVLASLKLFTDPQGIGLSPRKITVSTVGIIPAMEEFLARSECHLAISLHSPFDEERRSLMPIQHVYPLDDLFESLRRADFSGQRRLSFEYIMFEGINDSLEHARELVRRLNGLRCRVNLIRYHSVPGSSLRGSADPAIEAFQNLLKDKGLVATLRRSRGLDIQAACGLLSTKSLVRAEPTDY